MTDSIRDEACRFDQDEVSSVFTNDGSNDKYTSYK